MRDTYVYVCEGEVSREKKRKRLGANTQKNRANRGHSLIPNLSSFSFYDKVLMSLWYCWGLIQNATEFSLQHSHWWFSRPVTPSKLKWKPLNTGSLESGKVKEDIYTKSLAKNQVCAIFHDHMRDIRKKRFTPNYKAFYGDATFVGNRQKHLFLSFPTNVWILRLRNS